MSKLTVEVLDAARHVGCKATELARSKREKLVKKLREKYTDGINHPYFWEGLIDRASIQNKEAWQWIGEFVKQEQVIMLFIDRPGEPGVVFENGDCVVRTLWECTGFEFYLTDSQATYLLCYNHHDFLIATSLAANWIKERKMQVTE